MLRNLRFSFQRVDLADVIAASLDSVKTAAEAKSIRLDATLDPLAGVVLGYALIREVRAQESAGGRHVPAIALTAFASHADREEALALGFEVHLAKPANADDLTRTVASLVGRAARRVCEHELHEEEIEG